MENYAKKTQYWKIWCGIFYFFKKQNCNLSINIKFNKFDAFLCCNKGFFFFFFKKKEVFFYLKASNLAYEYISIQFMNHLLTKNIWKQAVNRREKKNENSFNNNKTVVEYPPMIAPITVEDVHYRWWQHTNPKTS